MNKDTLCHKIALEAAKAFCSSNLPEYINSSGEDGYVEDMMKHYFHSLEIAKKCYDNNYKKHSSIDVLK